MENRLISSKPFHSDSVLEIDFSEYLQNLKMQDLLLKLVRAGGNASVMAEIAQEAENLLLKDARIT